MIITVFAKTQSKVPSIEKLEGGVYKVSVKEAADQGKANDAICRALARYFECPLNCIEILSGKKSKKKLVGIKA